tara:strand:+ start:6434 stop:6775 length:342 start_codon:yes stop_codon:yes gene_type:complete
MGCFSSKKLVKIHNAGFDLMDADGDHKVSKQEVEMVATYFHRFAVMQSQARHAELVGTAPIDYLYQVIDKKVGSKLKRRDFNKFAYIIPTERWQTELLPALRRNEIQRLSQKV